MTDFIDKYVKPYAKAIIAFFLPGILMIAGIWQQQGRMPTSSEWLMALGLSIVSSAGVYFTPNKQADQGE